MRRAGMLGAATAAALSTALLPGLASGKTPKGAYVCKGTSAKPGTLKGRHPLGVVVRGFCAVNAGPARVSGTVRLERGSVLEAAFGRHGSRLTVAGDVLVGRGATFVLGCNKTESNCFDDPASSNPSIKATLSSSGLVTGNVISTGALGTLIHQSKVGGDIRQTGGGGGKSCAPPTSGAFAQVKSPVFSDYEDTKVGGSVIVSKVTSCYLGIARLRVSGEMSLTNNKFGDPDAIEVLSNRIKGNLVCKGNSAPPGPGVWDSSETSEAPGAIFPRKLERNQVGGKRIGQCRKAGPLTQGGPPAGGPF